MNKIMRPIALILYYTIAKRFPTQPVPGYRIGYWLRRNLVRYIFDACGKKVIVKQNAYFGKGSGIKIGDNSQIGDRSFIGAYTKIGRDVVMGPEVVIWSVAHRFDRVDIPINQQEGTDPNPVNIGDDVWLGQRVIIMPGITVGNHAVIGAGSVVTKDVPEWAVVAGVPGQVIKMRNEIK